MMRVCGPFGMRARERRPAWIASRMCRAPNTMSLRECLSPVPGIDFSPHFSMHYALCDRLGFVHFACIPSVMSLDVSPLPLLFLQATLFFNVPLRERLKRLKRRKRRTPAKGHKQSIIMLWLSKNARVNRGRELSCIPG